MSYLIDTNVISELRKGSRCNESVGKWWSTVREDEIHLSVLTIGELRRGVENIRRRDPRAAVALETWILRIVHDHGDRIIPVDIEIAEEWGHLGVPDPLPVVDGLIAATAKLRGLMLVTRNVDDFARAGIVTLNPWLG